MGAIVLLPSIIAITLAVWTRQVYIALVAGILSATLILSNHFTFLGVSSAIGSGFDAIAKTFGNTSSIKSIIFILCIGAMINIMRETGGIYKLIDYLLKRKDGNGSKMGAQLTTFAFGLLMCLEGIGSMMMVGLIGRPLYDRFKISRTHLAFVANGTGSPIAWIVPFGGAGVFLTGLLATLIHSGVLQNSGASAYDYLISAIPYQFYTILMIITVFFITLRGKDIQKTPLGATTQDENQWQPTQNSKTSHNADTIFSLMFPFLLLLSSIFFITLMTGKGNFLKGDISSAIYYSGFITLIGSGVFYMFKGVKIDTYFKWSISGMQQMLPAVMILALAFTLGGLIGQLGVGKYLSSFISSTIPLWLFPALTFLLCMLMSFSTGSSGATVSIMVPILIPLAVSLDLSVSLAIGAIISGAVFGDQSSPISDSVIVASSAANCPPEEHFRSQVPYTLSVAIVSLAMFVVAGIFVK